MREHDRLRWHCRRGLLELDILLGRFLDKHLATLDAQQMSALDQLLLLQDNDLLDLVLDRAPCRDERLKPVLSLIQEA